MDDSPTRLVVTPAFTAMAMLLAGTTGLGASHAEVQVHSKVEAVARVTGPGSISLKPGEKRIVVVQVAANFSWRLAVSTENPAITVKQTALKGKPGGFSKTGNQMKIEFLCSTEVDGPQSGAIVYTVDRI